MASKTALVLALDHLAQIQQHINAIDSYIKSTALEPKQRSAINKRRQAFVDLSAGALDLCKVLKADFMLENEKDKNARLSETMRRTRAVGFNTWKLLKENNLLYLLK